MSKSKVNHFESDVLKVVLIVGLIRSIIELYTNPADTSLVDKTLDFGYLLIFSIGILSFILRLNQKFIFYGFFTPLTFLLAASLFDRGGVASSSEHNIYAGILILCTTLKGTRQIQLVGLLIGLSLTSLALVHFTKADLLDTSNYADSVFNFIFMSLGSVIVIFYAKAVFDKRNKMLQTTQESLSEINDSIAQKTRILADQNSELEELNKLLESKIKNQIEKLDRQNGALNQYVKIILDELIESHNQVKTIIDEKIGNSDYDTMIKDSGSRLASELESLKEKIENV